MSSPAWMQDVQGFRIYSTKENTGTLHCQNMYWSNFHDGSSEFPSNRFVVVQNIKIACHRTYSFCSCLSSSFICLRAQHLVAFIPSLQPPSVLTATHAVQRTASRDISGIMSPPNAADSGSASPVYCSNWCMMTFRTTTVSNISIGLHVSVCVWDQRWRCLWAKKQHGKIVTKWQLK